ncbi:MAG TPA: SRPBCC family protein [Fimbriiglobus sp.]|nr:SRPBCC family protein [Fimbriiglobus sp.]
MKPITFSCTDTLSLTPEDIARQILDLANWTDFTGYGPLPGIKAAEFEVRTPAVVGTRIRVTNTDGSSHVEEVVEWEPDRRLRLDMTDFSPPLSRLATGFVETWEFERLGDGTRVIRSFEMHAKSVLARPVLWLVSFLLKRAVARHLRQMRGKEGAIEGSTAGSG